MISCFFKRLRKSRAGFTMVETAAAIALTGFLGLGASIAIAQVSTQTARNVDYTAACRQAMNAIHWMGQDIHMAQTISGASGFPGTDLVLGWDWWDNTSYSVNYTLEDGSLYRSYHDGANTVRMLVADNIDSGSTNCTSVNGTLTLTVTSIVGEGPNSVNVTRSREVSARPHL